MTLEKRRAYPGQVEDPENPPMWLLDDLAREVGEDQMLRKAGIDPQRQALERRLAGQPPKANPVYQPSLFPESTSSPAAPPAKISQWPAKVRVWMESGAACSMTSFASLILSLGRSFCGKTSLAPCRPQKAPRGKTSPWSWRDSPGYASKFRRRAGETQEPLSDPSAGAPGGCLTLSTSEWPKDAAACSLSQVLVADADPKYFLSPKACRGILRRAEKRGRELPPSLRQALESVAQTTTRPRPGT